MRINKNKSNKKRLLITTLTIVAVLCLLVYLFFLLPIEELAPEEASLKDVPTVTEDKDVKSTKENTPTEQEEIKTPTKTPGKTPAQYEGESVDDKPAYDNEQFRIPEEE